MKQIVAPTRTFTRTNAKYFLPKISEQDNKSKRGRSLLFAGSKAYQGAGVLAAKAALRAGSGYVTVVQTELVSTALNNPDFIVRSLFDENKFSCDAVLVGPGFGVNKKTAEIIATLKKQNVKKVVLDADALTVCAQWQLFPLLPSWIITPHTGELARILNFSSEKIENNREAAVHAAIKLCQCTVLLKGHNTLVGRKNIIYQIRSGNSALAKSGTGDVLAGIITAFRAQGLGSASASLLGAYLHGACADLWVQQSHDPLSMMASDLLELLPLVMKSVRESD